MKARLWQILFILNALLATEIVYAEDSKKKTKDLKEQNIMSVLYQQTAAERLAGNLQTFRSATKAPFQIKTSKIKSQLLLLMLMKRY